MSPELAFERVNKHRALAELVVYNRNWLPWWIVTAVTGDFCDQAERYLRGEGLPPLPVRLWWAYRHWKFKRASRMTAPNQDRRKPTGTKLDSMVFSNIAGRHYKPCEIIPLAPGQHVEFIPIDNGHRLTVTDMHTGERRAINISNRMLRNLYRPSLGANVSGSDIGILHTDEGDVQVNIGEVRRLFNRVPGIDNMSPEARLSIANSIANSIAKIEACKTPQSGLAKLTESDHRLDIWESNNWR